MMKIAYIDCFAGVAGDMLLAALLDSGVDEKELVKGLKSIPTIEKDWELQVHEVHRSDGHIRACHVDVKVVREQDCQRNLQDIAKLVEGASLLPEKVKEDALRAFTFLAEAEAAVHGTTIDKIHFHEVGAIDSIIDTIGVIYGFHLAGVEVVYCSSLPMTGQGCVGTAHGILPVPVPATLKLCQGHVPFHQAPKVMSGELVTPTGASLIRCLVKEEQNMGVSPEKWMVHSVGIGAGTRNPSTYPNICRILIGKPLQPPNKSKPHEGSNHGHSDHGHSHLGHSHEEHFDQHSHSHSHGSSSLSLLSSSSPAHCHSHTADDHHHQQQLPLMGKNEGLVVLETNIDDMSAEVFGYVMDEMIGTQLALDVWFTSIQMKKNRPGLKISVLCREDQVSALEKFLFKETTTFGIRKMNVSRTALERQFVHLDTEYGFARVKLGCLDGQVVSASPEMEDCRTLAHTKKIPLKQVMDAVRMKYMSTS